MYAELPRMHFKNICAPKSNTPFHSCLRQEILHIYFFYDNICFVLCSVQDIKDREVETFLASTFKFDIVVMNIRGV
jgi:hypothetical protein